MTKSKLYNNFLKSKGRLLYSAEFENHVCDYRDNWKEIRFNDTKQALPTNVGYTKSKDMSL